MCGDAFLVVLGGLLTGGFALIKDSLSHARLEKEFNLKVFVEKRLDCYQSYDRQVSDLVRSYNPFRDGIEPLKVSHHVDGSVAKKIKAIEDFAIKNFFWFGSNLRLVHTKLTIFYMELVEESKLYDKSDNPEAYKSFLKKINGIWEDTIAGLVSDIDYAMHMDTSKAYPWFDPAKITLAKMKEIQRRYQNMLKID